jgi:type I restriction enzyme S subunit
MSEWPMRTLGEIVAEGGGFIRTGPFGSQLHQSDYVDDPNGIPVVMPKDMAQGRVDRSTIARIDQNTADRLSHHLLEEGDIALSRRGDVGRSAWIGPDDLPLLCGTGSMRVHPGVPVSVHSDYLRYFFRSRLAIDYLEGQAVGATMPNLNAGIVTGMPVPILPLKLQVIAAEVLRSLEDLFENNRRRVEVLEEMARAIYREWFVRFRYPGHEDVPLVDSPLGQTPEEWQVAVAGELQKQGVLEIGDGYRAKNAEMSSDGVGLPFVRVANVQDGYLALEGADALPPDYADRLRSKISVAGDVVISMKGTVGRQALVQDWHPKLAYSPQVSFWRSLDVVAISSVYLYEWIRSEDFVQQCAAVKGATDMADYVNLTDQRRMRLLVPPRSVMAAFTERVAPVLRLVGHLRAQAASLASLRDLLLPKLVTGQIDVSHLDLDALTEVATA